MRLAGLAPDHYPLSRAPLRRDGSGRVSASDHPGDPRMHRGHAVQRPRSPGDPLRHGRWDHLRDHGRRRERRFHNPLHQLSRFQDPGRCRSHQRHEPRHMGSGDRERGCELHVPRVVRQMVPGELGGFQGTRMQVRPQRSVHPHASGRAEGRGRVHRSGDHVRMGPRLQRLGEEVVGGATGHPGDRPGVHAPYRQAVGCDRPHSLGHRGGDRTEGRNPGLRGCGGHHAVHARMRCVQARDGRGCRGDVRDVLRVHRRHSAQAEQPRDRTHIQQRVSGRLVLLLGIHPHRRSVPEMVQGQRLRRERRI